jgi:hypothetical protein
MKKEELVKECAKILEKPKVAKWYDEKLETKPQSETINELEKAITKGELTLREALSICLIVGVQWNVKFEGVP